VDDRRAPEPDGEAPTGTERVVDDANAPSGDTEDVVLLHSPTEDGKGAHVLRKRLGRVEVGQVRAVEHGKPLHGDLVRLVPREGSPLLYDVKVELAAAEAEREEARPRAARRERGGPPRVASSAYRSGWDSTFGRLGLGRGRGRGRGRGPARPN